MPDDGEVTGLLALMLLTEARRTARVSATGALVPLDEQDRGCWDPALIAEGHGLVRDAAVQRRSARAATRSWRPSTPSTPPPPTSPTPTGGRSWPCTTSWFASIRRRSSRSTGRSAVAEVDGPQVALAEVDRLGNALSGYHAFHATRADLLRRLGRTEESRAAYDAAIDLAGNSAESAHLARRRDQLSGAT